MHWKSWKRFLRGRGIFPDPFLGLFGYDETSADPLDILKYLARNKGKIRPGYELSALSFGNSSFYRYWHMDPASESKQPYDNWHAYKLENLAPGYFIHNIIEYLFPAAFSRAQSMWYSKMGKEANLVCKRKIKK